MQQNVVLEWVRFVRSDLVRLHVKRKTELGQENKLMNLTVQQEQIDLSISIWFP